MKKSVYEIITERIIEQLENGVIPWQKPWSGTHSGAYKRISNKPYSLLNQMILKHGGEYATFKQIPLLRYYNVFHISQVDGVEPKEKLEINEHEPIEEAEKIKTEYINRERLKIFEKATNKAFYTPTFDYIEVPCKEQYQNIEEFYSTLFHEMIHSTGHKNRLDRLET